VPLDVSKPDEESRFKPCESGAELSVGLVSAGPAQEGLVWTARGRHIFEWAIEERKVPKKWLDAECRRRVAAITPGTEVNMSQIHDSVKAELWDKVVPTRKHGWLAYVPDLELLLVQSSVRHAEYLTSVLRQALGSLPIVGAYSSVGFEAMVRDMITHEVKDEELSLGRRVDMYEGSGRGRTVVSFRNFEDLSSNPHIADHIRQCRGVASAGFNLEYSENEDEYADDVVASPYAELIITEVKDKEADAFGDILVRLDTAINVVDTLTRVSSQYAPDNWKKI
jgi:DNA recombination-dependent growth factor C